MDQYAKYSYTIISDQLQKLNPRLIMLSYTFLQNRCQLPGYCYNRAPIAADVF